jgi:hypothetical protein
MRHDSDELVERVLLTIRVEPQVFHVARDAQAIYASPIRTLLLGNTPTKIKQLVRRRNMHSMVQQWEYYGARMVRAEAEGCAGRNGGLLGNEELDLGWEARRHGGLEQPCL